VRCRRPAKRGCIAGSRRCCWSLKDSRSATRPSACAPRGSVFAGGSNATWRPMMPPPWRTGRAADDRTLPRGSPHAAWQQLWRATRAAAAIKPRVGRCHCSGSICSDVTASPSAPERCAGAYMRPTIAGTTSLCLCRTGSASGPEKGGIIRRLRAEWCTGDVLLCCDWTLLRLFPPLRATWARKGTQATVPITGANAERVLFGAINLRTAHRVVLIRPRAGAADAQAFLREIRRRYRAAGTIWLLADRASAHTAARTQMLAAALGIRFLWLPKQAPADIPQIAGGFAGSERMEPIARAPRQRSCRSERRKHLCSGVVMVNMVRLPIRSPSFGRTSPTDLQAGRLGADAQHRAGGDGRSAAMAARIC